MENQDLENRIRALEQWKEQRIKQQVTFPLDIQSRLVLANYFMSITGVVRTISGVSGTEFINYIGKQGDYSWSVGADVFIPYTVNPTTNVFTNQRISFQNDQQVYFSTSDTPPSPLNTSTNYFIINSTGLTFKVSATMGGAAIDITDAGVGQQYIYFF